MLLCLLNGFNEQRKVIELVNTSHKTLNECEQPAKRLKDGSSLSLVL